MNSTLRTLLVFALLVGAVVFAALVYRKAASGNLEGPAVSSAGTPIDETALDPQLKLALEAEKEGRQEEAIRLYQAVPADSPSYPTALTHLAVLAAREGDFDTAVATLLQLVGQHPEDPEVHASLGWVFYLAGRYKEAEFAALRTLELDSHHVSTRYNIGLYRIAQGRTQLAISSYIRAMRADLNGESVTRHRDRLREFHDDHPNLPGPHFCLAFFADSMQDPRTEIEELEHYLELAEPGPERNAATEQMEQARALLSGG